MQLIFGAYAACSIFLLSGSVLPAQTQTPEPTQHGDRPNAAMMQPVMALARHMTNVDRAALPSVFADSGVVIEENFAPYIFVGKGAASSWDESYRQHVEHVKDLNFGFGHAHDFDRTGDRVYFVLPTTWRGTYVEGGAFEEHGGWSFVLEKFSGQWRILAYGWAATDATEIREVTHLSGKLANSDIWSDQKAIVSARRKSSRSRPTREKQDASARTGHDPESFARLP